MTEAIATFSNVTKIYTAQSSTGRTIALKDVSLDLPKGQRVVLLLSLIHI